MIFFSSQCTIRCRRYYPASFCPSRSRYGTFSETHKTSHNRKQRRQQRSGTSRCARNRYRHFLVEVVAADTKAAHIVVPVVAVIPPLKTRESKVRHLIDSLAVCDHIKAADRDVSFFNSFQDIPNRRNIQRDFSATKDDRADTSAFIEAIEKSVDVSFLNIDIFGISAYAVRTAHIAPARDFYDHIAYKMKAGKAHGFNRGRCQKKIPA